MEKVVIFDFDGTVADDEDFLHKIYIKIAKEKNWKPLNREQYRKLFTANVWQALIWSRFRPWRLYYLVRQSRLGMRENKEKITLFDGMSRLILGLKKDGFDIYILSRNWQSTIQAIVEHNDLSNAIEVLEKPGFFSKHKSIKKLIKKRGYLKKNVWMVGDEVRDIYAAEKSGVNSIAVTWGFQDESMLLTQNPSEIAHSIKDIESVLNQGIIAT